MGKIGVYKNRKKTLTDWNRKPNTLVSHDFFLCTKTNADDKMGSENGKNRCL